MFGTITNTTNTNIISEHKQRGTTEFSYSKVKVQEARKGQHTAHENSVCINYNTLYTDLLLLVKL